jgi:hypothetical protein
MKLMPPFSHFVYAWQLAGEKVMRLFVSKKFRIQIPKLVNIQFSKEAQASVFPQSIFSILVYMYALISQSIRF